jgi:hypothetical protein
LLADRDGRRKYQRWPTNPTNNFQTENRLPRPRRSHDMQSPVVEMAFHLVEHASLIVSPNTVEPHSLKHRGELERIPFSWKWQCLNDSYRHRVAQKLPVSCRPISRHHFSFFAMRSVVERVQSLNPKIQQTNLGALADAIFAQNRA